MLLRHLLAILALPFVVVIVVRGAAFDTRWSAEPLLMLLSQGAALLVDALDARAEGAELLFQRLVTAVEVVDALDHGLALRDEPGDHQPR